MASGRWSDADIETVIQGTLAGKKPAELAKLLERTSSPGAISCLKVRLKKEGRLPVTRPVRSMSGGATSRPEGPRQGSVDESLVNSDEEDSYTEEYSHTARENLLKAVTLDNGPISQRGHPRTAKGTMEDETDRLNTSFTTVGSQNSLSSRSSGHQGALTLKKKLRWVRDGAQDDINTVQRGDKICAQERATRRRIGRKVDRIIAIRASDENVSPVSDSEFDD